MRPANAVGPKVEPASPAGADVLSVCPAFPAADRRRIEMAWKKTGAPGMVVARVRHDGIDALQAMGQADRAGGRLVGATTAFHLYSGTKVVTACAVMRLVEKGWLHLDTDVRHWFPELPLRHPVTVRQLASHHSGLSDTPSAFLAIHLPAEVVPSAEQALTAYRVTRGGAPGRRVRYRNINYALLGALVERVVCSRGKTSSDATTYAAYVEKELLAPWGSVARFGTAESSAQRQSMATGYLRRLGWMRWLTPLLLRRERAHLLEKPTGRYVGLKPFALNSAAIGGLVGSAVDFAPIVAEFLSPEDGVLSARSRQTMLTRWSVGAAGIASKEGVGLGWKQGSQSGATFWNHEGGGPGFCSELRLYPKSGVGFVILMNLSHRRSLSLRCHDLCEQLRC